jgi:putative transposase
MLEEDTQCIASALRNSILHLKQIPRIVYQDNGKAFKAKYFNNTDFRECGFTGLYGRLGIKAVFAKPYNAKAKVIERFFLEFQESFEKLVPTYSGSSIIEKPVRLQAYL